MKRPKLKKVTEDIKTTDHRDTLTKRQITEKKKKTNCHAWENKTITKTYSKKYSVHKNDLDIQIP